MATDLVETLAANPRHKGVLAEGPGTHRAHGDNPFCGDALDVVVRLCAAEDGSARIEEARFDGYACSLCTAAAEALLGAVSGMRVEEARRVTYDDLLELLGNPSVGRTRSGCVRLPLTVLGRALEEAAETHP